MNIETNPQLDIAFDYVRYTNKNIFLTGKAGTGKTTFLHQLKKEAAKRMAVVAPTGVAAINAGGVTIHSLFQMPFGPFLPEMSQELSRQRKFSSEKIRLIKSLDLLVIDEISMVRADLLDAIDDVLRRYRDKSKPFGGIQVLMIGDLHQLPPVIKEEDWQLLRTHYETSYFFGSRALQQTDLVCIELKHIYRQSDENFIHLLNKVRDNKIDNAVLEALNSRYVPDFQPQESEPYITLTAHNATAQKINQEKLADLTGEAMSFSAKIEGDFPNFAYPTEEKLLIKADAQVMFVRNDISREKLYYNGKIGKITKIENEVIYVKCPDDDTEIEVGEVEWRNVKYSLDEETKEIKEEIIGTFTQYPLKLAWAITIHKSQGLTFERAIIDANAAFAHGQVYVALSRCKSFEGIVLRSKIGGSSIKTDTIVKNYSDQVDKNPPSESHLTQSIIDFQRTLIFELFEFKGVKRHIEHVQKALLEHEHSLSASPITTFNALVEQVKTDIFDIADKFKPQIRHYFLQEELPEQNTTLQARIQKAGEYFEQKLSKELLVNLRTLPVESDNKATKKEVMEALESLQKEIFIKNACFVASQKGFSTQTYLRAKADAELNFTVAQKMATFGNKLEISKDTMHPELYATLKKWRDDEAAIAGTDPYYILPVKSLLEITQVLPTSTADLRRIKGFGEIKIKQFGAAILAMIEQYCKKNNLKTDDIFAKTSEKMPKKSTKTISFDLYKAGRTVQEIAIERSLTVDTIQGHLAHFIKLGELDIHEFIEEKDIKAISEYLTAHQIKSFTDVNSFFGGKYSYGQLRLVADYMRKGENV